jgi:hypothetical protein
MRTYKGVKVQLYHSSPRRLMEMNIQLQAPAASPGERDLVAPRAGLNAAE